MKEIIIAKNDAGQRVDRFLMKAFPALPRSYLYKAVRSKKIKVNRKRCEIAQRLQEADCFALASVSQTFGVSYLEALSCGVPVIATRCGGPECFVNEHNGIMVEPDNVDDLAKAMQTMYYNISYYNRAEIARKIREDYSAQAVASRLMEQYERLARRAGSELVGSFSR